MKVVHCFSFLLVCHLCGPAVGGVGMAPWIPRLQNLELAKPPSPLTAEAVALAPAAVSESFRRLFLDVSNGSARASAYESECLSDFKKLMLTPGHNVFGAPKAFEAIDALGKPGSEILYGHLQMYGAFDECLNIGEEYVKYWAVPLNVSVLLGPTPLVLPLRLGMCVPVSCNMTDLHFFVNESNNYLQQNIYPFVLLTTDADEVVTTTSRTVPLGAGAIVMVTVCSIFLFLAAVGTLLDVGVRILSFVLTKLSKDCPNYDTRSERAPLLGRHCRSDDGPSIRPRNDVLLRLNTPLEFITAFSLFKNVQMILSTKQPPTAITSLNGIRVISMFWVILAHTFVWFSSSLTNPLYVFYRLAPRFSAQVITNGYFSVDSFFFLSGVLVAYLTLREMERKRGRFPVLTYYLHRYLRLTMVYAFILFFYWFLTLHLGSGPTWQSDAGEGSTDYAACRKYWWTNLLYINNFYPWKLGEECMGWTWYLANDMQFFVLAPLVLIPLYHVFPVGLLISGVLLAATFGVNGAISGKHQFSANTLLEPNNDIQSDEIYIKPYCRAAPYIVGILLGFVLFKKLRLKIHWTVNWALYGVIWAVAAGCCFSTVYGLYDSFHGHKLSLAENVSYFMFSRFVWAVGLALMVYACHNGYGWVVNDFLSMKFWIPLSRLTYTAYLIHPIVLSVTIGTTRGSIGYTDTMIAVYAVAMVVLSFGAAGVVAAFVEFPLSNLEMVVFKVAGLKPRESVRRIDSSNKDHLTPPPDTSLKN